MDKPEKNIEEHREESGRAFPTSYIDERDEYDHLLTKFDQNRQKKLLRKTDWHVLPVLTLFYLISFMDRSNIGNARLQGLEADLHLTSGQYNWYHTQLLFRWERFMKLTQIGP
jgi:hypothetical protein